MTKEEYIEIGNCIKDIQFDIYEHNRELKGLKGFLEYLQNKPQSEENDECIKIVEEAIAQKENIIRLMKKEQAYYQTYYQEYEKNKNRED